MHHEPVKTKCPSCNQTIMISPDTTRCPNCSTEFNQKVIQDMFQELALINNKKSNAQNLSKGVEDTGKAVNNIGCAFMLVPIGIIAFIIILALLMT